MRDVAYVALFIAFFVVAVLLVNACGRIVGDEPVLPFAAPVGGETAAEAAA